jgi:hypothetical protein
MSLHQYDCSAQLTADRLNTGKLMRGFSAGVRVNYIDRVNYDFPTGNTTTFLIWFNIQKKPWETMADYKNGLIPLS